MRLMDSALRLQRLFRIGRRLGLILRIGDLGDPRRRGLVEDWCDRMEVTATNVDAVLDDMTAGYI